MKRMSIATLIAVMIAMLVNWNSAHAATITSKQFNIFMADYRNGTYYAALVNQDGDSVTPIKIEAPQEDIMPAYGNYVTATLDIDSDRGYTGTLHMFSTEYNQEYALNYTQIDESDSAHIVGYCTAQTNFTSCQLDGQWIQAHGFITNGEITKLRSANAYSTDGIGYLVQNGNLISYAVTNDETREYKVLLPVILF